MLGLKILNISSEILKKKNLSLIFVQGGRNVFLSKVNWRTTLIPNENFFLIISRGILRIN